MWPLDVLKPKFILFELFFYIETKKLVKTFSQMSKSEPFHFMVFTKDANSATTSNFSNLTNLSCFGPLRNVLALLLYKETDAMHIFCKKKIG